MRPSFDRNSKQKIKKKKNTTTFKKIKFGSEIPTIYFGKYYPYNNCFFFKD